MDSHRERVADSALAAYRSVVLLMGHCADRAVPALRMELANRLAELEKALGEQTDSDTMDRTNLQVESELTGWADSAAQHHSDIERELCEVVAVVSRAARSVGERDQRYARELGDVTGRLSSLATENNIAIVRRSVFESTRALKACVQKMTDESKALVQHLTAEVQEYRVRLEESERQSATDPLTGLANRRAVEKQLETRIDAAEGFCLFMIDLDDFKAVNERFGHIAGDDLLKQFAVELKSRFTPADLVGRWGGDEFVILMSGSLKEAEEKAEQVRRWTLGEYKITSGERSVKTILKASIGAVEWNGEESASALLTRADAKVFRTAALLAPVEKPPAAGVMAGPVPV